VTISGRRKLPGKNIFIEVEPEVVELEQVLNELGVTHQQLIDIGILVGTDFNPDGVKGLGPKTALKLIKEYGNLEKVLDHIKNAEFPVEPQKIREIFLKPKVTENYKIEWKEPNVEGVIDFICGERDFSEDRVRKALEKMQKGINRLKGKTTLEKWFG
jgi:flap endonuclease-1